MMTVIRNKMLFGAVLLIALGCTPSPEPTRPTDAQNLVDSLVYVKAKNGLCFAVATTRRVSSNLTVAENQMITLVPCLRAGLRL